VKEEPGFLESVDLVRERASVLLLAWLKDGACRDRTGDLRLAKPALSQLS
jgi:hypothetical protein